MAGQLSYSINIQWSGAGKTKTIPAVSATLETGLEVSDLVQEIGTTSQQLVKGDVDGPVAGYFRNLDAENPITITDGDDGDVLAVIPPRQNSFILLDPDADLWAKADTAAAFLDYAIFNKAPTE